MARRHKHFGVAHARLAWPPLWQPNCRFPNSVSSHEALTCGDARRLTSSHRGFVSSSCHFFNNTQSPIGPTFRGDSGDGP